MKIEKADRLSRRLDWKVEVEKNNVNIRKKGKLEKATEFTERSQGGIKKSTEEDEAASR